jgi:hypothetical protein
MNAKSKKKETNENDICHLRKANHPLPLPSNMFPEVSPLPYFKLSSKTSSFIQPKEPETTKYRYFKDTPSH